MFGVNYCIYMIKTKELFKKSLVTEQDSLRLNDSLLYSPGLRHIKMRAQLMKCLFPENQFYESVKRMYVEEHDGDALIMLARFGREEDTVFVLENLRKYSFPQEEWSWAYGWYYYHQNINLTDCALLTLDPDSYFDLLHEKYGRPNYMGW